MQAVCEIDGRQVVPGDLNVLAGDLLLGFRRQSWRPSLPQSVPTLQRMLMFKLGSFALLHSLVTS